VSFVWRDAGRVVVFDQGVPGSVAGLLAEHGFESFVLLHSPRAASEARGALGAADAAYEVPAGQVPDLAAGLLDELDRAEAIVAWGGGRVIDTAKALAAVIGASVAAIPTTLSGAEMTGIHRLPAGAESRAGSLVRPRLVLAFPDSMTGQPEVALRASAMNALAHGADCLYTPFANPVSRMTALRGAELIATSLDERRPSRERADLALGSILCGYAIDSGMYALHHVVCQTLVRVCGTPHAETNAAILPRAMAFMAPRAPTEIGDLASAIGCPVAALEPRILALGGEPAGLGSVGGDETRLDEALEAILARPELQFTPEPPNREELLQLIGSAW
jgi:alcohol dehydrogenase class IV